MATEPEPGLSKQEQLQEDVMLEFDHHLAEDEELEYVASTDLLPDGEYGAGYLLVTDQRLLLVYETESEPYYISGLDEIEQVRIKRYVGNGSLYVHIPQGVTEFARFSLTQLPAFQEAAETIDRLLAGQADQAELSPAQAARRAIRQKRKSRRCPECGHVLRRGVCPVCLDKRQLMFRLLEYVKPYWKVAALALTALLAASALQLAPPYLTGRLVDEALEMRDMDALIAIVLLLAGVYLSKAALSGLQTYLNTLLGQGIVRDLRNTVFSHLQYLDMDFFNHVRTGSILSRTTSDVAQLRRFIVQSIQDVIQQSFMIVGIAAILVMYDWRLALATLVPMPFIIIAVRAFIRRIRSVYRRVWVRRALMKSVIADAIPGIKVVKSFAQEEREIDKFDHRSDQVFDEWMHAARYRSVFNPFLNFATSFGTIVVWSYGGYLVIQPQDISIGDLVAFLYYVNMFYNPLRQLSGFADVLQEAATAAERVFEILDTKREVSDRGSDALHLDVKGRIEFRNVHFAYEANEPVLQNINVTIEPGEMVGLVGPSGAGKTTFVNLVPRLYDVTAGELLIDGRNVRDLDIKHYRDQIGIVLQSPLLFHGTIAENIAYGEPDTSLEEIIWAADAANAHEFIMDFPDGYDTHTGERGLRLSGGQKQRISIARAILKNPQILILDEATSSVDTETERLIQEAIDRLVTDRTTLAIAHRLSTLQNADRLLVIEDGILVEQGTHEELMDIDGVFARLVRMQSEIARTRAV